MRVVRLLAGVGAFVNAGFMLATSSQDPGGWGAHLLGLVLIVAFNTAPFVLAVQAFRHARHGWAIGVLAAGVTAAIVLAVVSHVRYMNAVYQDGIIYAALPMMQLLIVGATLILIDALVWWQSRKAASVPRQGSGVG